MGVTFTQASARVFRRAKEDAQRARLPVPHLEHLLLALLDEGPVRETLASCEVDPVALAQQTRDFLAQPTPYDPGPAWVRWLRWLFGGISPAEPLHAETIRVQAIAYAGQREEPEVELSDVLAALLCVAHAHLPAAPTTEAFAEPYRGRDNSAPHPLILLRRRGITVASVLRFLAHGESPSAPAQALSLPPEHLVEVVVHNDPYTTAAFVRDVLRAEFGLDRAAARRVTMLVHRTGRGVVATLPFARAEAACRRVRDVAERRALPLKVTMQTPP